MHRVVIAIQNPGTFNKGALQIVDAFYDERSGFNGTPPVFSIAGYSGALPQTIQNMPEEQFGAIFGAGDGSLLLADYSKERITKTVAGVPPVPSSVFVTRNQAYFFAASQAAHTLTIGSPTSGASLGLNLPDVFRISVNPAGTVVLAFVQNSPYVYYPRALSSEQSLAYSGGPTKWPTAAVDCEPQIAPLWCLFQMQSPDATDATGTYYGAPLTFDHPIKAVFSSDGGTAYILSCGPECGGTTAAFTPIPVAPILFPLSQASGLLPTPAALATATVPIPGGASNALVSSSTMYVVGQCPELASTFGKCQSTATSQSLFGGNLTVVNLVNNSIASSTPISDGQPGTMSRMVEADDDTLWIAMTGCTTGVRYATTQASGYGCLTMVKLNPSANPATNPPTIASATLLPYIGNATGVTGVLGLHKIYTAEGGQVYIYSTKDGSAINNDLVTVTGTAYDVAYIDALTDADNTVY